MSPQKFKAAFGGALLNLHWRQWQALGVMGRVPGGWNATIDLEALIVSTLAIGLLDRRLLLAAMEWVASNDQLVSVSRIKSIGRDFGLPAGKPEPPCLEPGVLYLVSELLKRSGRRGFTARPAENGSPRLTAYSQVLGSFKVRHITALPDRLAGAAHLQLAARSLFGNDARADLLAWLLLNQGGNPFLLAREIHSDYKNVYLIMEGWRRSGLVERRGKTDFLTGKARWLELLQTPAGTPYVNWASFFGALCRVEASLKTEPWAGDQYLLSSLFRDIHPMASPAALVAEVRLPAPARYRGGEYFEPFAKELLGAMEKLG
jgi:hypothetical protein